MTCTFWSDSSASKTKCSRAREYAFQNSCNTLHSMQAFCASAVWTSGRYNRKKLQRINYQNPLFIELGMNIFESNWGKTLSFFTVFVVVLAAVFNYLENSETDEIPRWIIHYRPLLSLLLLCILLCCFALPVLAMFFFLDTFLSIAQHGQITVDCNYTYWIRMFKNHLIEISGAYLH